MLLVRLNLATFDNFGLIHQTKRALKSNRKIYCGTCFFFTLLFSQKKFCTIQVGWLCSRNNPEGLLAIYSSSKSEEKICNSVILVI